LNSFNNRNTNAATESFNAKQKAFRVQFRGVLDINFSSLESQKFLLEKKKEKQERNGDPPNFSREPFSIGLFT
jgi:transposase